MRGSRTRGGLAALLAALLIAGCGGDDGDGSEAPAPAPAAVENDERPAAEGGGRDRAPGGHDHQHDQGEQPGSAAPRRPAGSTDRRLAAQAERTYRDYVDAINAADGDRLCELLPDAVSTLKPAVRGGDCPARIGGSIGYRDPRGYPVWKRTVLNGIESVSIDGDGESGRVTAEILTEFSDRAEPSVESDIAYLEIGPDGWRLAKPTGALYRAIGRPELPPSVITPP